MTEPGGAAGQPGRARRRRADGPDAAGPGQAGDRRGRGPRGRRWPRARAVVRPAGGRRRRGVRRVLPALGCAAHRRRHRAPARGSSGRGRRSTSCSPDARWAPTRRCAWGWRRGSCRRAPRARPRWRWRRELAALPQGCLRSDRASLYAQWDLPLARALTVETDHGMEVLRSGEARAGADRFAAGAGRHGTSAG